MTTAVDKIPASASEPSGRLRIPVMKLAAIGDQVVVSLTNFVLTIAIGRAFAAEEFASFGIGLSIGLMVQGLQRHAMTIPLMLRPAGRIAHRHRAIVAEQYLLIIIAIVAGSLAVAAAWHMSLGRYGHLIALSSLVSLIVYLQLEFSRTFLVKTTRPWSLIASATWYCVVALALAGAALLHFIRYETLLFVLGGAMTLHALALMMIAGSPQWSRGWRLLRYDLRRYGGWSALATLTYSGYNHAPLLLLGALVAPVHAAIFVATRSLMQPLQIIQRGLDIADKSAFANVARKPHTRETLRLILAFSGFYALTGVVYCISAGLFADDLIGLAYGSKFSDAGSALIAWLPGYILMGLSLPLETLVYARRDFRSYFLLRGLASVVAIALSVPLLLYFFETGAIAACAAGWLLATCGTLIRLIRNTQ